MKKEVLRVSHLCFSYNQDSILSEVSFSVFAGEIVSVVGNNGVGKTVLGKILSGEQKEDSGMVLFHGKVLPPGEARKKCIHYIQEEEKILGNMTVAENILMGQEPDRGCYFHWSGSCKKVQEYLKRYGLNIHAKQKGFELSAAQKRMVMLVRELIQKPELLIIDGALDLISYGSIPEMVRLLKDMVAQGTTIVYLTHNHRLAASFSHRLLFLQKGLIVYEMERAAFADDKIQQVASNFMKEIKWQSGKRADIYEEVLKVQDLTTEGLKQVSFTLRRGEIVGLIGFKHNGISEFLECLSGSRKKWKGKIWVDGALVDLRSPKNAIKSRIRICGDNHQGVLLKLSETIKMNLNVSIINRISRHGLIQKKYENMIAKEYCEKFGIHYDIHTKLTELNFGAVSKVAIASCMISNPRVLILNKATRGLDEEGMQDLYEILDEIRKNCGVILNFSNVERGLGICNRIIFWGREGILGELKGEEIDYENIVSCMSGQSQ